MKKNHFGKTTIRHIINKCAGFYGKGKFIILFKTAHHLPLSYCLHHPTQGLSHFAPYQSSKNWELKTQNQTRNTHLLNIKHIFPCM